VTIPVLEIRAIHKRFPGVHALRGVSLAIRAGEVVALLGENGAGKSTLMRIVGGIEKPDSGELLVDGARVESHDVRSASALGIAFIHQELHLIDNLDVAGNILLGREPTGWGALQLIDRQRLRDRVRPYLDQLDLDVSPDTPVASLSIAQQQLVEIAKALSLDARLLIMDEPTSSLTTAETARLHRIVADLRRRGVGVIYITHRLAEVPEIADRAVVLRDGSTAGTLERADLTHDNMIRLMVGRDLASTPLAADSHVDPNYLRVDGLRTRRYPQHAISFAVGRGEVLGVAGLVGAGRSDIAEAMFGSVPPAAGNLILAGATLTIDTPADAIRHGIFLVPEDRRLCGLVVECSVKENVSLPALRRYARFGLVIAARERRSVEAVCRRLQVKARSIEVKAAALSGGNQQKVVLAKWLALGPKVLIVDEPTRGIDVGAKAEIYRLLRGLADAGMAVVMISSDMEELLRLSDRIAVIHEGRLTGVLDRAACTEQRIMALAVGHAA
jgi:ribose transport system ATP-binding protein